MGDEIEREAIERSGEEVRGADLVIVVLDQTQGREGQMELVRKYPGAVVVVNKVDRAGEWKAGDGIRMVAIRGEGVEELRREIRRRFGVEGMEVRRARWWTERQREILGGVARGERSLNEM
jgi:tRNA U34 5-carboxymethylaminomethyl modifying GTPase MnmE/TrmE